MDDIRTPILNDLPAQEDSLDFKSYVATLVDVISSESVQTPLTIGVFGNWGSGKTTLMGMVREGLPEGYLTAWFDAWKYEREETLWRALLLRVLEELDTGLAKGSVMVPDEDRAELIDLETALYAPVEREESGNVRIDFGKLGAGLGKGAVQVGLSFLPGVTWLTDLMKSLGDQGSDGAAADLMGAIKRERSTIRIEQVRFLEQFQSRFRALVEKYVTEQGTRLVVFVDDLDRCLPEKAVEVLEAVKLFLDVPGCVFLLGIDPRVIEKGVEVKYREFGLLADTGEKARRRFIVEGRHYLEKIIQLPFHIPPIERKTVADFVEGLLETWPNKECARVFAESVGDNPRQVKRTVNVFLLLSQLAVRRAVTQIKEIRLAKVVAIQHAYQPLYELLKGTPRLLRDLEDYYRSESRASLDGDTTDKPERVEPPPVLAPHVHNATVRTLLTMHPVETPDANFTGLSPEELGLYFTLTKSAEAPRMEHEEKSLRPFEPQMVKVPGGKFQMGSTDDDEHADDDEKSRHPLALPDYSIGKYPVTNAEYQAFITKADHSPPQGWNDADYPEGKGGHPVVGVSWHDATAYCGWLAAETKKHYRLPSEAEWEKAARGTDGLIYPWGNEWDETRLNSKEAGPGDTTPVGQYSPSGDSLYGAADMAGNVWEWTLSLFKPYPYDPDDGREDLDAPNDVPRVVRGGAFYYARRGVRAACRGWGVPGDGLWGVGFRVVLSPLPRDSEL